MTVLRDLDGLTSAEIALLVANSEGKLVSTMEARFGEHKALIEGRLDKQDTKLSSLERDLSALVGSSAIPGLVAQIKEIVDENKKDLKLFTERQTTHMAIQNQWHEESLEYRASAELSRDEISGRVAKVESQVQTIRGLVYSFRVIARGARGCVGLVKTLDLWKVFGGGLMLLVVDKFWPQLSHLLVKATHVLK